MTTDLILMAVMVLLSAYFSATETAFSSLNKTRVKTLADKGNKKAALVYSLSEQYDKLISTILIGNNIVNIALASIGTVLFVKIYGDIGATISTVVVTVVVLIFGEITPKSIAKDCPEKFAMFSAPFMKMMMTLFVPLTMLFSAWKKIVSQLMKLEPNNKMSQEELLTLVEEVQQSGSIDQEEGTLLHNAIAFSECAAEDVATHRVDLETISSGATKEEIAHKFSESRYSRLLVYKETMDNIIGVVHQKDFYHGMGITSEPLDSILTPVVFVTQRMGIRAVLRQMQHDKVHVAVVLDEYGGTYGIVTMEDILEELVGEILDEHDEHEELESDFRKIGTHTYRVDALVELDEFFAFFDVHEETKVTTLNGWLSKKLERIPVVGDVCELGNLTLRVVEALQHRVQYVDVTVNDADATAEK